MIFNRLFIITGIALISVGSFTSCKKKGCTDLSATNYNSIAKSDDGSCEYAIPTASEPSGYTPTYNGTFGALIGIKSVSTTFLPGGGSYDTEVGTALAVFSEDGGANYELAGTVSVNGNPLSAQSNNTYVYKPLSSNPFGLPFGSTQIWSGSGATWPTFYINSSMDFPTVATISSSDVAMSSDYTLNCSSAITCDSIYFSVYGPNGTAMKLVAGGISSYTFSASDLSGLGAGSGFVQIVGINYDPQTNGGRDYYILNETTRTKSVKIN